MPQYLSAGVWAPNIFGAFSRARLVPALTTPLDGKVVFCTGGAVGCYNLAIQAVAF